MPHARQTADLAPVETVYTLDPHCLGAQRHDADHPLNQFGKQSLVIETELPVPTRIEQHSEPDAVLGGGLAPADALECSIVERGQGVERRGDGGSATAVQ